TDPKPYIWTKTADDILERLAGYLKRIPDSEDYRQGQKCWGEAGMDALWSAATVKIIGSGIDDADFADRLSRMIGDHDVQTVSVSTSESGKSTSVSMRTERILPPDAIRALPKGKALMFATGIRTAMLDLCPWYKEAAAKTIGPASAAATKAITERALAKAGLSRDDFEAAS
ncbi:TraM recognition domain-containing protein, partial [Streptomyces sp. NPDC021224]|uniref:TraM recognition domain-containing protein n=1 Tax=unclassified Streptomyces TaxID=2593676 RepID=UPI0037BD1054